MHTTFDPLVTPPENTPDADLIHAQYYNALDETRATMDSAFVPTTVANPVAAESTAGRRPLGDPLNYVYAGPGRGHVSEASPYTGARLAALQPPDGLPPAVTT